MSRDHLIIPNPHTHYQYNNKRAEYLGHYIAETKPDVVICLGDLGDMPSLSSYDKGRKSFEGRTYVNDLGAVHDFNDRLWSIVKRRKRKLPRRVILHRNHEQRIERAVELQPELDGIISYKDLGYEDYYDDVVPYVGSTPGIIDIDGIMYSHYLVSGVAGRPIAGEHHAHSLLSKKFTSCTVGHNHTLDFAVRTKPNGKKIYGLVAGCYQDYIPGYAGTAGDLWWSGLVACRGVDDGRYDPEFISINSLKKAYGRVR